MRLLRTYTAFWSALRTIHYLCVRNTSFARKSNFAYVYDLCALSGLCIWIRLLRVSDLMRMNTTYALKATYAYKVRLLCVKRLMLQGHSWTRWRGNDSPADPRCLFTLRWPLDGLLDESSTVLIRRPRGSVQRMWCSVFSSYWSVQRVQSSVSLRRSWLPIGLPLS